MSLPRRMILTPDVVKRTNVGLMLLNTGQFFTDEDWLIFFLCYIMANPNRSGVWSEYGKLLANTDVRNLPTMFSRGQLITASRKRGLSLQFMDSWHDMLEGQKIRLHQMAQIVLASKSNEQYKYFSASNLRKASIARAMALVRSRSWRVPFPDHQGDIGDQGVLLMAPALDMVNMDATVTAMAYFNTDEFDGSGGFRIVAETSVRKGEEAFYYYGDHCREELFTTCE